MVEMRWVEVSDSRLDEEAAVGYRKSWGITTHYKLQYRTAEYRKDGVHWSEWFDVPIGDPRDDD